MNQIPTGLLDAHLTTRQRVIGAVAWWLPLLFLFPLWAWVCDLGGWIHDDTYWAYLLNFLHAIGLFASFIVLVSMIGIGYLFATDPA